MPLRRCSVPIAFRRKAVSIPLGVLVTFAVYAFWDLEQPPFDSGVVSWPHIPALYPASPPEKMSLPELDAPTFPTPSQQDPFCAKRFSPAYLEELRNHAIQYCNPVDGSQPQSKITCFHAHVRDDNSADSFCFASGATWDSKEQKFRLDCPNIRQPDVNETARGLEPFGSITASWFETGPKRVFSKFVTLSKGGGPPAPESKWPDKPQERDSFVILVKREGNNNLWHSLMEIWSMLNSIDALRISRIGDMGSRKSDASAPFYQTPADVDNTYIVMLDDYAEESTFDLWRFFSRHPIVKLKDMIDNLSLVPEPLKSATANIIVPMAGASNPLWQNDWAVRDCREAPLLNLLVRRIFEHYQVPLEAGPRRIAPNDDKDITVTFIDRRGTRQLLNHAPLFEAVQARFPNVVIKSVDFATLSLPDQLRLAQSTDVLVGVHGAGLTHTMFMRANAGAVVEIQPENMGHKGFRNLAAMTGHRYFSAQAEVVLPEDETEETVSGGSTEGEEVKESGVARRNDPDKPWQSSHVRMEEDRFLALMDVAIKSLYNEGMRNHYIV
ncbi:hypothetical protein SEUCBS140593_002072 [Sporothrix eucalyptigena]|uniref:EGF domain-specific O-linked N-acetylglucosamine transferase n=1 Tax=Sporothrix eucalyptigena TaxID=1812306 RepID=A0ABP0B470_9PEZI